MRQLLRFLFSMQMLNVFLAKNSSQLSCQNQSSVGFASSDGCTFQYIQRGPFRVFYMDEQYVTQNQAAIAKIQSLGMNYSFGVTCDDPTTAVPEWLFCRCKNERVIRNPDTNKFMQLCCRKLAIWMDGTIHVGGLFKLLEYEERQHSGHDRCQFHLRN